MRLDPATSDVDPNVQAILDAGLLCLDEPQRPTARDKNRERWRQRFGQNLRYRL